MKIFPNILSRTLISKFVVLALLLTSIHALMHPQENHAHDESCAVYVLEELFLAHDVPTGLVLLAFFIPFIVPSFRLCGLKARSFARFAIRAPPFSF